MELLELSLMKFQTPEEFHGRVHGPPVVEFLLESHSLASHFNTSENVKKSADNIVGTGMFNEESCPRTGRSSMASIRRHQTVQHFGHSGSHVRIFKPVWRSHENYNQSQQIIQLASIQRAGREAVDKDNKVHDVGQTKFWNASQQFRRVLLVYVTRRHV